MQESVKKECSRNVENLKYGKKLKDNTNKEYKSRK